MSEKQPIHKQCREMHAAKYCVCCMVKCCACDHVHAADKPHVEPRPSADKPRDFRPVVVLR